nr:hypothetical protein [Tanacetum cinerariifolium]
MQKSKLYRAAQEHRDLYDALVKSYKLDKELFESYGKAYSLKRDREDKDEDPLAGLDQEESVFEIIDTEMPQNQGSDLDNNDDQPNVELLQNLTELEYHFEECYKAVTDQHDWNNPEGQEYPFDLSKPLLLIKDRGRQVVLVNYFINNDLEYLKVTHVKVMKWYDFGYSEEIVSKKDYKLYKFMKGRRSSTGSRKLPEEAQYKFKRNRLMRSDELYKFSDGKLTSVRSVLHEIDSNLRMDYLLKIRWSTLENKALLTNDIPGFKKYEEYKDDWIYEWNNEISWIDEKPWTDDGVWTKHLDKVHHECNPLRFKNGKAKWPTYDHDIGKIENDLVQDNAPYHANEEEEQYNEGRCELLGNTNQEPPTCKIECFKVINYSFGPAKEFVAIKECGYNDWMKTKDDACHAYRYIFVKMDEGWYLTRAE